MRGSRINFQHEATKSLWIGYVVFHPSFEIFNNEYSILNFEGTSLML